MNGPARSWAVPAAVGLLLSAVAVGGVLGYRHLQGSLAGGSAFAEVELMSLSGQGSVRLSDFRGRPLVVNFFASWCPACITELPTFERAAQEYSGRVAFLGVDEQDDAAAGLSLARDARVSYPLVRDTFDSRLFRLIHGTGMPTTVFLASSGTIRQVYSGELSGELLRERLNEISSTASAGR